MEMAAAAAVQVQSVNEAPMPEAVLEVQDYLQTF
jgi:hypothetical protein